jgi:hypothetical protein
MFKRKTLFVVGAGASAEFNLPVGRDLAAKIGKMTDVRYEMGHKPIGVGDLSLFQQLTNNHNQDVQNFQNAGWLIRDGIALSRSIDDFLDLHRTNQHAVLYGKATIVKAILEAERGSALYFRDKHGEGEFDPTKLTHVWLAKLVQILSPGIPRENIKTIFDQISFVVFNYDRCIEFFLQNALQKLYGIDESDVSEILRTLNIVHPYGVIPSNVGFGSVQANCVKLIPSIKTYSEQIEDAKVQAILREKFEEADHIVFLGFAYHDQNMKLLKPEQAIPASKKLFGTAYGMSGSDVQVVSHELDSWFAGHNRTAYRNSMVQIENKLTCAGLFDEYAKSLTAA